jgi:hypothetical protein
VKEDPEVVLLVAILAVFAAGLASIHSDGDLIERAIEGARDRERAREAWLETHPLSRDLLLGLPLDGSAVNIVDPRYEPLEILEAKNISYVKTGRFAGAARFRPPSHLRTRVAASPAAGTWAAWVRIAPGAGSAEMRILDANVYRLAVREGVLTALLYDGSTRTVQTRAPPRGEWFHVAMTWRPGGRLRLYLNGKREGAARYTGPPDTGRRPITVGAAHDGRHGFEGEIDELSIHARELEPWEVDLLMNVGLLALESHETVPPPRAEGALP